MNRRSASASAELVTSDEKEYADEQEPEDKKERPVAKVEPE
jgi:hypothetical protein